MDNNPTVNSYGLEMHAAANVQFGQLVVVAVEQLQGWYGRQVQLGELVVDAPELHQGRDRRQVQLGQLVVAAPEQLQGWYGLNQTGFIGDDLVPILRQE